MSKPLSCVGMSEGWCKSGSTAAGGATCQWDPMLRQCLDLSSGSLEQADSSKPSSGGLLEELAELSMAGAAPLAPSHSVHHVRSVRPDPGAPRVGHPRIPLQPRPASAADTPVSCKAFCASQGFDVSKMEATISGLPSTSGNCYCRQKGPLGYDSDTMGLPHPKAPLALQFPGSGP